ncbi:MAG: TetR/AcrR family transcriptional regulator [Planctomycetaceae bacterium]|jgi:AcrR family transcriptional regulator|nr:TetR/AcrR family transcriptional regulator [Planctomycetaceae bacterium]
MEDTKTHILKISLKLFLRKNFKEVTMQEIVQETGLSKGAFYHYFDSKENVFEDVVKYFYENQIISNYNSYPNNSLKNFYTAYVNQFQQNAQNIGETNPLIFMIDAIKRLPNFRNLYDKITSEELSFWKSAVKNAKENGEITTLIPNIAVARMFIAIGDGILLRCTLNPSSSEELIKEMKTTFNHLYSLLVSYAEASIASGNSK